jgi:hypothetical protein
VGQHPERVGKRPGGKGVGAVSLVEDGERGFEGGILEVGVKTLELVACEHTLVDDDPGAEGGNVERGSAIGGTAVFNFVAGEKEEKFEGVIGKFFGVGTGHEELFDFGGGSGGFFPEDAQVDGDGSPGENLETAPGDDLLGDPADMGLGVVVGRRKKKNADPEIGVGIKALAEFFDLAAEKFGGDLGEDAGAIAGFGIGIEGAPVGELADAGEGALEDGVQLAALDVRDETDAAGVVLVGGMVKALGRGEPVIQREFSHAKSKGTGDGAWRKKEVGNPLEDQRVSGNSPLWLHGESVGWWFASAKGDRGTGVWPWF